MKESKSSDVIYNKVDVERDVKYRIVRDRDDNI